MRVETLHLSNSSTFGRRLAICSIFTRKSHKWSNSPEVTFAKCCKYALFYYKNAFFHKKICIFAFFVVPLHSLLKKSMPRWRNR